MLDNLLDRIERHSERMLAKPCKEYAWEDKLAAKVAQLGQIKNVRVSVSVRQPQADVQPQADTTHEPVVTNFGRWINKQMGDIMSPEYIDAINNIVNK